MKTYQERLLEVFEGDQGKADAAWLDCQAGPGLIDGGKIMKYLNPQRRIENVWTGPFQLLLANGGPEFGE